MDPEVRAEIAEIVERCMQKVPPDQAPVATWMIDALDHGTLLPFRGSVFDRIGQAPEASLMYAEGLLSPSMADQCDQAGESSSTTSGDKDNVPPDTCSVNHQHNTGDADSDSVDGSRHELDGDGGSDDVDSDVDSDMDSDEYSGDGTDSDLVSDRDSDNVDSIVDSDIDSDEDSVEDSDDGCGVSISASSVAANRFDRAQSNGTTAAAALRRSESHQQRWSADDAQDLNEQLQLLQEQPMYDLHAYTKRMAALQELHGVFTGLVAKTLSKLRRRYSSAVADPYDGFRQLPRGELGGKSTLMKSLACS